MTAHGHDYYSDIPVVCSVPEAAAILGVSERFTRTLVSNGELGHLRIHRLVKIPRHSLLEFLGANGSAGLKAGAATITTATARKRGRRGEE